VQIANIGTKKNIYIANVVAHLVVIYLKILTVHLRGVTMNTSPTVTEILKPPFYWYGNWRVTVAVDYYGKTATTNLEFKTESEANDVGIGYEIES